MRNLIPIKTLKIITLILFLLSVRAGTYAQSPYALFGDNSKMLEAKSEPITNIYKIRIQSPNGTTLYAEFNLSKGFATLYNAEGSILSQDSISDYAKAMFTAIDPHAENYYHSNPYSYCGGNPVNAIDPDGRDYWYTNDYNKILQFMNYVGNGYTQFDFSEWDHATDADICGKLVYNDETHKFYTSYAEVFNGEVIVTAISFDANITPVSASGLGYYGAFIYEPIDGFWEHAKYYLNGLTYTDKYTTWRVDKNGRIIGIAPLTGTPPLVGLKGGKLVEKMGRAIINMSSNRAVQQKQIDQLCRKYNLSKEQRRKLHQYIHGEGLDYNEIENLIKELFNK